MGDKIEFEDTGECLFAQLVASSVRSQSLIWVQNECSTLCMLNKNKEVGGRGIQSKPFVLLSALQSSENLYL